MSSSATSVKEFFKQVKTSWNSLSLHQRTSTLATVFVLLLVPAAYLVAQSPIKLRNQAMEVPITLPGDITPTLPSTPAPIIPINPAEYKTLSFNQTLEAELKPTDPVLQGGTVNFYKVVLPENPYGSTYNDIEVFIRSCGEAYDNCQAFKGFTERSQIFDSGFQPMQPQSGYDTRLDFDAIKITGDKTYYITVGSTAPVTTNKKYLISFWYEQDKIPPDLITPTPIPEPRYSVIGNPTYTNVQYDLTTGLSPSSLFLMLLYKDGISLFAQEQSEFKYAWALSDSSLAKLETTPYCPSSATKDCPIGAKVTPLQAGTVILNGQIRKKDNDEVLGGISYNIKIIGSLSPTPTASPSPTLVPTAPASKAPTAVPAAKGKTNNPPAPRKPAPKSCAPNRVSKFNTVYNGTCCSGYNNFVGYCDTRPPTTPPLNFSWISSLLKGPVSNPKPAPKSQPKKPACRYERYYAGRQCYFFICTNVYRTRIVPQNCEWR
ncbi:hypothetical protein A3G67_01550 [Candidatus Roizmanbacteria bacterium RIFCSPLOWO2_12_FULL_40_12]|uniref:Uncharacterized protein n=1 Tax=Candidatus Roizmanbacteria bacterium RIFCSPLOWO2_01_FULL_40_42 TaxID=1802066 RepID=A0A1F7J6J7_9BACT|nr:MAG: hypothetical protein A2779_02455 [Candidatus Roizmanbacteria bacterium RIFCSPHIGHO2_01_FULL_40_98]OGK29082.1 MAG: hypothetical protein A3C31_03240 [Candidatus Roizmanbacteria bacterium RIFCSPHIGHO2_02_FULL_40_53]OGK29818.1 MAG: hypothetical protein A2W49_04585 [Candidatus Roizmanbacteria bacterium RIFCSPHIGHO2_12_41_18]OGK36223.1 MAG: hypothetical protein A3E69_01280 [Candidatus Roizmanbacteria bacterium RIFCSPHIGHO2_12_FULL_40_130]OGK51226.1 MAG: hypothetical protein A3B50_03340 [Candi